MSFFASDEFEGGFDVDTGRSGIGLVANAIQFWSTQNYDADRHASPSVQATADAFRMTVADVRQAVDWHPWMFLEGPADDPSKQTIEHEGE